MPETTPARYVLLRPATLDDAGTLRDLERTANLVAMAHIFPPDRFPYPDGDVLARWRLVLADPAVTVLLAEIDDQPVAFTAYDGEWLRHLGVHPDHWGSGLAERLTDAALSAIATGGCCRARLWVLAGNHRARRFYERTGWVRGEESGESEFPPYPVEVDYWRAL